MYRGEGSVAPFQVPSPPPSPCPASRIRLPTLTCALLFPGPGPGPPRLRPASGDLCQPGQVPGPLQLHVLPLLAQKLHRTPRQPGACSAPLGRPGGRESARLTRPRLLLPQVQELTGLGWARGLGRQGPPVAGSHSGIFYVLACQSHCPLSQPPPPQGGGGPPSHWGEHGPPPPHFRDAATLRL